MLRISETGREYIDEGEDSLLDRLLATLNEIPEGTIEQFEFCPTGEGGGKIRADLFAIKDALDNDSRQFEIRLREILKKARDATVQWAEDRIKNLEPEQIINLTVDTGAPMVKALNDLLTHFWQRGRDIGLSELPEKIQKEPAVVAAKTFQFGPGMEPLDAMRAMTARSWLIKGVVEDALKNAARRELMLHLQGGRTNNETIGALREVFEPYVGDVSAITPTGMRGPEWPAGMSPENILAAFRLENIVRTESAWALNQGRVSMGDAAGDYVVGYEYSSILDERTTAVCDYAGGGDSNPGGPLLLKKEDPRTAALLPPNHFNCRSTVIYLTTDDAPIEFSKDAQIDKAVSLIQDGFS